MRLMAPVGLPSADGTPPHVEQVPIAMVAAAPGASLRSHVAVGTGCGCATPSTASTPMAEKYPPVRPAIRSSATDPSYTTTYGAPSLPSHASEKDFTNSAPASTESTG